jgi:hypothetical protein
MAIEEIMLKCGKKRFKVRARDPRGRWYKVKSFDLKRDADRYERELFEMRDRLHCKENSRTDVFRLPRNLGRHHEIKGQ